MDVISTYKFARISARKARDVAREIQGLPVSDALDLLRFTPRKGARLFSKTMKTALADAGNNFELPVEGLYVKSAVVGEGPTFKRFKARARGSAGAILKRTSHLTVILSDEEVPAKAKAKASNVSAKAQTQAGKAKAETKPKAKSAESETPRLDEGLGMVYDSPPAVTDDLKLLSGVGPALEEKLNSVGIYRFEQIASWTERNVEKLEELISIKGRVERDNWIAQAKELAEGKQGN